MNGLYNWLFGASLEDLLKRPIARSPAPRGISQRELEELVADQKRVMSAYIEMLERAGLSKKGISLETCHRILEHVSILASNAGAALHNCKEVGIDSTERVRKLAACIEKMPNVLKI